MHSSSPRRLLAPPPAPALLSALSAAYPHVTPFPAPPQSSSGARRGGARRPRPDSPVSQRPRDLKGSERNPSELPPSKRIRAQFSKEFGGDTTHWVCDAEENQRTGGLRQEAVTNAPGSSPRQRSIVPVGGQEDVDKKGRGRPVTIPGLSVEERRRRRTLSNRESAMRSLRKKAEAARKLEEEQQNLIAEVELKKKQLREAVEETESFLRESQCARSESTRKLITRCQEAVGGCVGELSKARVGGGVEAMPPLGDSREDG